METIDISRSEGSITRNDSSQLYILKRSEVVQQILYLFNIALLIGSVVVLLSFQEVLLRELSKATLIISLVLFIHLAVGDGGKMVKQEKS